MPARNQYVIIRDDLLIDPVTVVTEGLLIGRLLECEVLLNNPAISRAQAGIKQIEDDYYLFPLRPNNPVILNGRPVDDNEALAAGDVLRLGPFQLDIDHTEEAFVIRVSLQIGMVASAIDVSDPTLTTDKLLAPVEGKRSPKPRAAPIAGTKALDIFWDKRIREAGKMVRPSPLFPKTQKRSGKSQFNWLPTTDLGSRWPASVFIWAVIAVGLLAVSAAFRYTNAYVPAPLSRAHTANQLSLAPAIAVKPNAASCTSCHSWKGNVEERCAGCHHTDAFTATVIKPHEAAGVGCVECHAEHQGVQFNATEGALQSCTSCHNDSNHKLFNGRRVGTPHGGIFGYPVVNGVWSLHSINEEDWNGRNIPIVRLATDTDEKWCSKQFHAFHSERVRVVPGISGNSVGQLSCSSCHKSFDPIDRQTPRTTCGICHNGRLESASNRVVIAGEQPNCTSCHVQHVKDKRRWGTALLWQVGS
jgi:pSer/pThr/pTyr-binding forkhead associated (FHA) protein